MNQYIADFLTSVKDAVFQFRESIRIIGKSKVNQLIILVARLFNLYIESRESIGTANNFIFNQKLVQATKFCTAVSSYSTSQQNLLGSTKTVGSLTQQFSCNYQIMSKKMDQIQILKSNNTKERISLIKLVIHH
ncbi:hypothetical protein ACTFIV_010706 [Dictyostelium citrinum]